MTIIHISTAESWRGGEQQIAYLISGLTKLNINQIVCCPAGSPLSKFCSENAIPLVNYRKKSGFSIGLAFKITYLCRKSVRPVLHVHDSQSHSSAFFSTAFLMNKTPVVVHRRVSFEVGKGLPSRLKYNHNAVFKIICVSDYVKNIVQANLRNTEKAITLYDGINMDRFEVKPSPNYLRNKYNLSNQNRLIGNISALTAEKDLFTFVDTAALLSANRPDLRFFILGDGPLKEKIIKYIADNNLADKIFLTGFIENIPEILPELDLILFTSVMEGLGTSLLDAFACKIPVVSTDAGGIPEIVLNNITGLTCGIRQVPELTLCVEKLLDDNVLRNNLTENAYNFVKGFTIEKMSLKILDVYKQAIEKYYTRN